MFDWVQQSNDWCSIGFDCRTVRFDRSGINAISSWPQNFISTTFPFSRFYPIIDVISSDIANIFQIWSTLFGWEELVNGFDPDRKIFWMNNDVIYTPRDHVWSLPVQILLQRRLVWMDTAQFWSRAPYKPLLQPVRTSFCHRLFPIDHYGRPQYDPLQYRHLQWSSEFCTLKK